MKTTLTLIALTIVLVGCASTDKIVTDESVKRAPTSKVEIYKGEVPQRPYKTFATYSYLGPAEDEIKAAKFFVSQAKKAGADAIIIQWPPHGDVKSMGLFGANGGGFGSSVAYVFKATAIVWTDISSEDAKASQQLVGRWRSISLKAKNPEGAADNIEFNFLPDNQFLETSFLKGKSYPSSGKYQVKGDRLVIWTKGTQDPDSSASFSVIDNQLVISSPELQITLQKQ